MHSYVYLFKQPITVLSTAYRNVIKKTLNTQERLYTQGLSQLMFKCKILKANLTTSRFLFNSNSFLFVCIFQKDAFYNSFKVS